MADNQTVKGRLIAYIKYLGIGQGKFEAQCGLANGYVNNIRKSITPEKLQNIARQNPNLNTGWLMTGEGSMLRESLAPQSASPPAPAPGGHVIKYFANVDGAMGGVQFLDNPDEASADIVIPGFSDCQFAINAYGDSMSPLIRSGQIIVLSEWRERFIDWGEIYLVVTRSGYRTVKRVFPATSEDRVVCRSENEQAHPPFEVEKEDIVRLFIVKGWINRENI